MTNKAFSFIELIIYIAITAVITVSMVLFSIKMLEVRGDAEMGREVLENAEFFMNKIVREVHDAASINSGSFDVHPGVLTLNLDSTGTITFDTATKTVGSHTLRYLRIDGEQVTSDLVNVSNFVFTDLSRDAEPSNIQLEITLESFDGSKSLGLRTAISLRE